MAALLPLLVLHATLIAVKGSDAVCPSPTQVRAAIEARLPGVLVPIEQEARVEALSLSLSTDRTSGAQSFTLVDPAGTLRLRRELPPPASAAAEECPALAETVALMVERYLQDLGYRAEAPPAPERRRWDLFVGATWRPGADGLSAYELRLGAARSLGARGRLALALVAGIEGASQQEWPGASGNLRRFPVELRLLWRAGLGPTTLEIGPFAAAELLWLDSHAGETDASDSRLVPSVGAGAGLRIPLGKSTFARVVAGVGVALLRYDFVTLPPDRIVAFGTERVWVKMGVEAGFSFW
jgi:hypothetical protein